MKNFTIVFIVCLIAQFGLAQNSQPLNVSLKIDPDTQCQLRYQYYPNLEAYFDNYKNEFIYNNKGQWIIAREIPAGYRGYSLFNKINVPITDYDDDNVTQFINIHKKRHPYTTGRKIKEVAASGN